MLRCGKSVPWSVMTDLHDVVISLETSNLKRSNNRVVCKIPFLSASPKYRSTTKGSCSATTGIEGISQQQTDIFS